MTIKYHLFAVYLSIFACGPDLYIDGVHLN